MKKTLIALMALAGVALGAEYVSTYDITAADDLYADQFTLTFTLEETYAVTGNYDILAAYYQTNNGNGYTVNAFQLNSNGSLTLNRGNTLTLTAGALTESSTINGQDSSTFVAVGSDVAYTLKAGTYTLKYLGGANRKVDVPVTDAAYSEGVSAELYLDGVKVAGFTGGSHNMNGAQGGGLALTLQTNEAYNVVYAPIPEPTTATLSLLALAGLAARRRRK